MGENDLACVTDSVGLTVHWEIINKGDKALKRQWTHFFYFWQFFDFQSRFSFFSSHNDDPMTDRCDVADRHGESLRERWKSMMNVLAIHDLPMVRMCPPLPPPLRDITQHNTIVTHSQHQEKPLSDKCQWAKGGKKKTDGIKFLFFFDNSAFSSEWQRHNDGGKTAKSEKPAVPMCKCEAGCHCRSFIIMTRSIIRDWVCRFKDSLTPFLLTSSSVSDVKS